MPYIPAPRLLKAFQKHNVRNPKQEYRGGIAELERSGGNIYEWDSRHGRVEKYNKGEAPWEFDPETGEQINPPNPDYEVEP